MKILTPFQIEQKFGNEIYLIKRDVRPMTHVRIEKKYIPIFLETIKKEGLFCREDPWHEKIIYFYIYKHKHLKNIINYFEGKEYDESKLRDWIGGKMYGYSEREIAKFLRLPSMNHYTPRTPAVTFLKNLPRPKANEST